MGKGDSPCSDHVESEKRILAFYKGDMFDFIYAD